MDLSLKSYSGKTKMDIVLRFIAANEFHFFIFHFRDSLLSDLKFCMEAVCGYTAGQFQLYKERSNTDYPMKRK